MSRFAFFLGALLVLFAFALAAPAGSTEAPVAGTTAAAAHHEHHGKHHDGKHHGKHHVVDPKVVARAKYEDYENTRVELDSSSLSDDDDDDDVERDCGFFDHWELRKTLAKAVCGRDASNCGSRAFPGGKVGNAPNGGFGTNVWLAVVNRAGRVCAVIHSGDDFDDQWLFSRLISVQKASTANGFSLDEYALSTANLQDASTVGSLAGLTDANPANPTQAYAGTIKHWGGSCTKDDDDSTEDDDDMDPLCGFRVGGTVTFGGGLALYDEDGHKVGAIGVSGETSCADHAIAWRIRHHLKLDYVPNGPVDGSDKICFAGTGCAMTTGFVHKQCGIANELLVAAALPATRPVKN